MSIREYDRIVAEYLASGRSPTFSIESESYTVAMVIRDYLRHCKAHYGTGASSDYHNTKSAVRLLRDLYAENDASEVDPVAFKAIRQRLVYTGRTCTAGAATGGVRHITSPRFIRVTVERF